MGGGSKSKRKNRNKSNNNSQKNGGDEGLSKKLQPSRINDPTHPAPNKKKKKSPPHDSGKLEEPTPRKPAETTQKDNNNTESPMMISTANATTATTPAGRRTSVKNKKKNPLYSKLQSFLNGLTQTERDCFFSNLHVTPERRAEIWMAQADLGEELVNAYSWAILPDMDSGRGRRIMRILAHFAPLVEMGCGKNAYWCRQMQAAGINVIGYDMAPQSGGQIIRQQDKKTSKHAKGNNKNGDDDCDDHDAFQVRLGGPKDLSKHSDRTLFLCYPDENDEQQNGDSDDEDDGDEIPSVSTSMGARCLQHYTGNHVIHVGEIYGDTNSMDQAPWGRSSSPEFQQRLASEFHCILQVALPGWLHVRDTLSVWKRSEICTIVYAQDDDDDEGDDEEEEEEVQYRHVPVDERLPTDRAAPCIAHLLLDSSSASPPTAMPKGAAAKDDDDDDASTSSHGGNHHRPSKKPKLVARKKAKRFPGKSKCKEDKEQSAAFSKEAGYSTPW